MSAPHLTPGASVSRCLIVTGPCHTANASWLQEATRAVRADQPSARCAILTVAERGTGMERFAPAASNIIAHLLVLPCQCCPAASELPRHVQALVEASGADWLFVNLPALAATGLIAQFDALVRWPREIVLCLDAKWTEARRSDTLSFFQFQLISSAERVIETPHQPSREYVSAALRGHESGTTPVLMLV